MQVCLQSHLGNVISGLVAGLLPLNKFNSCGLSFEFHLINEAAAIQQQPKQEMQAGCNPIIKN